MDSAFNMAEKYLKTDVLYSFNNLKAAEIFPIQIEDSQIQALRLNL
jgi:hypothetical protein